MPMSEETCRAIDILRSLRRASIFDPWTASELAVVVQYGDEAITERLAKHFRLDKSEEDHGKIHDTVRQIVSEIAESKGSVPALAGVRHTLGVLRRNHWVRSARGKGYWLTKSGEAVSLLDVMNACGYNAAITRCCHEGETDACFYASTCAAQRFYKQLAAELASAYSRITVADIDSGVSRVEIRVHRESPSQKEASAPFPDARSAI